MMKKVGIISRHAVPNYGSFLQAYALQQIINSLGYDAITIDYIPKYEKGQKIVKARLATSKWNNSIVKRIIFIIYQSINYFIMNKFFAKQRVKYLKLSKECCDTDSLRKNLKDIDIFCTGSDQVWNTIQYNNIEPHYFLDFVDDSYKKISYAASFGERKANLDKRTIQLLKQYSYLSVREDTGVEILNKLGVNGTQVLDPTLLLGKKEWEKICVMPSKNNYILVYQVHNDNNTLKEYAKKISETYDIEVVRLTFSLQQLKDYGHNVYLPDIGEFIGWLMNAKCVITDSFHATAFSINFNKNFIEVLPKRNSSRNLSILRLLGLEERVLYDPENKDIFLKEIDYCPVNEILMKEREKSLQYLKKALEI